jgi:8-oxo-dGTP pyrophosphatase MutT (NUDIX family)
MITFDYLKALAATHEENNNAHNDALHNTGFWGKQGSGCLVIAQDTKRFLLALRSKHVQHSNTWGVWGGAVDKDEDPKTSAIREFKEETGYNGKILGVKNLYVLKHHSGFVYFNYLIIIPTEFKPRINWESKGFKWCEYKRWPEPLHFGLQKVLEDPASIKTIEYVLNGIRAEHKGWWNSLDRHQQEEYLANHPNSSYKISR